MEFVDVAIIGGGPAGLTAAASLARQLHTAIVFDSGVYRNAKSSHMHMVPTWDHKDPKAFRSAAREDISARYKTIQFVDVAVAKVDKKSDSHFKVTDAAGKEYDVRKIILAVGSADVFPDIPGYEELWAKRIYHCLFCFGYEDRGAKSVGVLAAPPTIPILALNMAGGAAQLGEEVTLYTHGSDESAGQLSAMAANSSFKVEPRKIERLVDNGSSLTVHFTDGSTKEETFLAHHTPAAPQGPFAEQLGLALTPTGEIQAEAPFFQTSARGVFAAGDVVTPYKVVNTAIFTATNAAVAAAAQLQAEKYGLPQIF